MRNRKNKNTSKKQNNSRVLTTALVAEANSLCNALLAIKKDRVFAFACPDGATMYSIKREVPEDKLENVRSELFCLCANTIAARGGIAARCIDEFGSEVFGISVDESGCWQPVPKGEILARDSIAPNGTYVGPEKGVRYTEIQRPEKPLDACCFDQG